MEACATAHHWARELIALGHEVRLMPPAHVKAYVKRNKNDAADAEAICEAVTRFVPIKDVDQQSVLMLHRARALLIRQRTMLVNALRAHMAEFGVIAPQGLRNVEQLIEAISDSRTALPNLARSILQLIVAQLDDTAKRIRLLEARLAKYHLTQTKQGISSLELARRLGITQNAAWKLKHKLAQLMLERNAVKRMKGKVQMDNAYLGGERSGPPGRGAEGKTPFVAAVETTDDGKPHQMILRRVKAFSRQALQKLASTALTPGAEVVSDGLACFAAVTTVGCAHKAVVTGSGPKAAKTPAFKWVNTALANIKAALVGTYRAVRETHAALYLAEFEYRFNRRYDLGEMIPRLAGVALTTAPMPYRLLKLADVQT